MALLLDLCEGPTAMLTLDEDCVSVVFPPSAADSPEMTRPLEKLRFPNKRLSVDEDDETCGGRRKRRGPASLHTCGGSPSSAETAVEARSYLAGALLMLGCLVLRVDPAGSRVSGDLRAPDRRVLSSGERCDIYKQHRSPYQYTGDVCMIPATI